MLIFLNFGGGGGGGRWYVGPLLTLVLPLLFNGGFSLLAHLFGFSSGEVYVYNSATGTWQRRTHSTHSSTGSGGRSDSSAQGRSGGADAAAGGGVVPAGLVALGSMIATAVLTVLLLKFVMAVRRDGLRTVLRRVLVEGFGGGWQAQGGGGQQQRRVARTRSERIEHVAKLMQSLPLEVYHTRAELERMSVAELKQLLKKRGVHCPEHCLEKSELVELLSGEGGNSTAQSCSICCEDYESADVLRVLRCGHRFHLECVDRWFLSSTDYSRPPACPMCNAELEDSSSSAGAGSCGGGAAARRGAAGSS